MQVLAIWAAALALRRSSVAQEATAEALGEVVDSQRLELEAEAARVMGALEPREPERETNPDHFQASTARCFMCGSTKFPCDCSKATS